jgi:polyisoprenyl-teichoic acid--peptidoglycan teichoic acid transferase
LVKNKKVLLTIIFVIMLIAAWLVFGCLEENQNVPVGEPDSETAEVEPTLDRDQSPAYYESYKQTFNLPTSNDYNEPLDPDLQVNILLLGLDERGLSDAIVIVSYNAETFDSSIISIKRDTYVSFQTWSKPGRGHNALGWASYVGMGYGGNDYLGGAEFMAKTIERLLDIKINSYASISFEGLVQLVDAIGGVSIYVPGGFAERAGTTIPTGFQRLSGEEALIFARHRKNPRIPEPGSISEDGDRIRRNQRLLKAVLEQCKDMSTDELLDIFEMLEEKLFTNMDDWDLLTIATVFYNQDPSNMKTVVLPGELIKVYEDEIETDIEYFFLDEEETDTILSNLGLK